ncbi:hypothetical protein DIPPA_00507 [Diplonema papillatum]|nr:hypothetical protein DIPPA_00507 [Diplonema papillatum]
MYRAEAFMLLFLVGQLVNSQVEATAPEPAPATMIMWLRCRRNLLDTTPNDNNAAGVGVTYEPDQCGTASYAVSLDGTTGSYILPPGDRIWNSRGDFSFGFRHKSLGARPEVVLSVFASSDPAFLELELRPDGVISLTSDGAIIPSAPSSFTHGQWNHFLVTRKPDGNAATTFTIYVNGSQVLSSTRQHFTPFPFPDTVDANAFVIGQRQTALGVYDSDFSSRSLISDFRVFDACLLAEHADREGRAPGTCAQALQDRPFVHYRLQHDIDGNFDDSANDGENSPYAGVNNGVTSQTGSDGCWDAYFAYSGSVTSYSNLSAGPALTGLQDFTVSIWLREIEHSARSVAVISVSSDLTHAHVSVHNELLLMIKSNYGVDVWLNHVIIWDEQSGMGLLHAGLNFVAIQREGMMLRLFVDGALKLETMLLTAYPIGNGVTNGFYLANDQDTVGGGFQSSQAFRGYMNDLQIWGRALTAEEIAGMYDRKCKHLLHWWPMNGYETRDRGTDPVALTMHGISAADGNCIGSNKAAEFAGTKTSYIAIDGFAGFKEKVTDFTVTAVFKLNAVPLTSVTIINIGSIFISASPRGSLTFESYGCELVESASIGAGTWYHVAATQNDGFRRLFLGGILLEGSLCSTRPYAVMSEAFIIGNHALLLESRAFNGTIFDVRFYNYALTPLEATRGRVPSCVQKLNRILHYGLTSSTDKDFDRSGNLRLGTPSDLIPSKMRCKRSLTWERTTSNFDASTSGPFMTGANDFTVSITLLQAAGGSCFLAVKWTRYDDELSCCVTATDKTISCRHPTYPGVAYETKSTVAVLTETHFSLVRDGLELKFYLDGVLDITHRLYTQLPFGPIAGSDSVSLGQVVDRNWLGSMADFKMWNRALSAKEVAEDSTICQELVGWWRMEGADMTDSSRAQQDGSVVGNVLPGTDSCGRASKSMDFGGTADDYARLANPEFTGLQDFTLSTWVNPRSLTGSPALLSMISRSGVTELLWQLHADGKMGLTLGGTEHVSEDVVIASGSDTWYHVAAARSWDTLTFHVAGALVLTTACGVAPFPPISSVTFSGLSASYSFDGRLRDFRIYDYALTDVRGLQGLPSPPACPAFNHPVFRYRMDGLDGLDTMKDSSGNNNDGTLSAVTTREPILKCVPVPCAGESLHFPGNSAATGFAAFPAGPLLSGINDFTVSFWVRASDTSVTGVAVNLFADYLDDKTCNDEIMFRRVTGDQLSVYINCEEFKGTAPEFPSSKNIMWTVTRRNQEVAVYRNGWFVRSYNHPRQVPIGKIRGNGSYVGQSVEGLTAGETPPSDADKAWEGVIADFQFWEGAMTETEVAETYEVAFCDCTAAHTETTSRFALNGKFTETGVLDEGLNTGSFPIYRDSVCRGSLHVAAGEQHTLYSTANPSKAFTMALYAKMLTPSQGGFRLLLHVGGTEAQKGFGFGVKNDRLVIRDGPDTFRVLDVLEVADWRHYVVVYDGEVAVIYIDELAVHDEAVDLTLSGDEGRGKLSIGGVSGDASGTESAWAVDEVVLFDGVVTVAEARSECDRRAVFSRYSADVESNVLLDSGPAQNEGREASSYRYDSVCSLSIEVSDEEKHCMRPAREVPQFAEPWTVSAYAKMVHPGDRAFVHIGGDEDQARSFGLGVSQGSMVWSTVSGTWNVVHPVNVTGTWHHYAATYDSNMVRFYFDEEEVGAASHTFDLSKGSHLASMCVGCTHCGDASEMKYGTWLIDEAVFAHGVIPMAEMRARCALPPGPFGRYHLDGNLVDTSPAGNDLSGGFTPGADSVCGGSLQLVPPQDESAPSVYWLSAARFPSREEAWTLSLYAKRVQAGTRLLAILTSSWILAAVGLRDGSELIVNIDGVMILTGYNLTDDDWHHYTVTWNRSTVRAYVDELMIAETGHTPRPPAADREPTISLGGDGNGGGDAAWAQGEWLIDEVVFSQGVLSHAALRCPPFFSKLALNGDWSDAGPANNEFPGTYGKDDDTVCGGSLRVAPNVKHVNENWKQIPLGAEAWTVSLYAKCAVPGERLLLSVGDLTSLHTGIGLGVRGTERLVLQVSSEKYIPLYATKVDRLWHSYAVTYNGSRVEVFVDEVSIFQGDWELDLQSNRFAIAAGAAAGEWLFDELMVGHGIAPVQRTSCDTREVFTRYSFDGNFADTAPANNSNPPSNLQFVNDSAVCSGKSLQLADNAFYALDNTEKEPGPIHWSLANYAACLKGEASSDACDEQPLDDVLREVTFCGCSEECAVFPKDLPQNSEPWTVSLFALCNVEGNRAFVQLGDTTQEFRGFSFGVGAGLQAWISFGASSRDIAGFTAERDRWYHYVAVYDSNAVTIFVDGVAVHKEPVVLNLQRCSEMGNLVIGSQLGRLQQDTRRGEWLFDEFELGRGVVAFDRLQRFCIATPSPPTPSPPTQVPPTPTPPTD